MINPKKKYLQNAAKAIKLHIFITKWSLFRIEDISNRARSVWRQIPQIDGIRELEDGTGWGSNDIAGATDGVLARRWVFGLPDSPQAIDLGVVQVEKGVSGATVEIAQVAADNCATQEKFRSTFR